MSVITEAVMISAICISVVFVSLFAIMVVLECFGLVSKGLGRMKGAKDQPKGLEAFREIDPATMSETEAIIAMAVSSIVADLEEGKTARVVSFRKVG
jgi:Na+-transporting methylmalonyl-CoA/oxaloacetate decarboxylase gamma subunit